MGLWSLGFLQFLSSLRANSTMHYLGRGARSAEVCRCARRRPRKNDDHRLTPGRWRVIGRFYCEQRKGSRKFLPVLLRLRRRRNALVFWGGTTSAIFRKRKAFDVEGRSGRRQPRVVPSPLASFPPSRPPFWGLCVCRIRRPVAVSSARRAAVVPFGSLGFRSAVPKLVQGKQHHPGRGAQRGCWQVRCAGREKNMAITG